ncbi:hypothetical protein [Aliikangiella sp. IMCC44359]|uniref:hypothetical protein n=1 Tax=Aliikangiella sp. IMCC44359 TaxID=3459125 RepID=UPI00403AA5F3
MLTQTLTTNSQNKNNSIASIDNHAITTSLRANQIGLKNKDGSFKPCAVSLTPWVLSQQQFQAALKTATTLSILLTKVSNNIPFLLHALNDFSDSTSLLYYLKNTLQEAQSRLAINLNLSRQDLLLNKKNKWQLVESNAIAAGMGPLNEKLVDILKVNNPSANFVSNPAIQLQSQTIYDTSKKLFQTNQPLIVFVTETNEDNIYDQIYLKNHLKKLGAQVLTKTLFELKQELISKNSYLYLNSKSLYPKTPVSCFYFRTGYNLSDYHSYGQTTGNYLELRLWIEKHRVVSAPKINFQLATSKWVQMKLSALSADDLSRMFLLSTNDAKVIQSSLNCQYLIPSPQQITQQLNSNKWILKSQNEGGGNVYDGCSDLSKMDFSKQQLILMEKIKPQIRKKPVTSLTNNQLIQFNRTISELGIFTLGNQHQYGGYLLRTKPEKQLETGVHSAGGMLDTIVIE